MFHSVPIPVLHYAGLYPAKIPVEPPPQVTNWVSDLSDLTTGY